MRDSLDRMSKAELLLDFTEKVMIWDITGIVKFTLHNFVMKYCSWVGEYMTKFSSSFEALVSLLSRKQEHK